MAIEVSANEVIDLSFRRGVQILELVHRLELDDVETVREHSIGLPFEQVLAFIGGDVRHGREHIGAVRRGTFDAVSVVDAALAGFVINVEVLEVVVEVDRAGAEVASEEGCVGGEDGRDVDMALAKEGNGKTGLPLVEVCDDDVVELAGDVLEGESANDVMVWVSRTSPRNQATM